MPPEPPRQRKRRPGMTGDVTSRQIVPKSPACPEGLFLMDGIAPQEIRIDLKDTWKHSENSKYGK